MQSIVRAFVLVVTALLNNPRLPPWDGGPGPAQEDSLLLDRMREHQERLEAELLRLEEEEPQQDTSGCGCYFWTALSLLVFLVIEMCRWDLAQPGPGAEFEEDGVSICTDQVMQVRVLLGGFYDKCVRPAVQEHQRVPDFVEGLVDELLEAWHCGSNRDHEMQVEDCVGVGSVYEGWRTRCPFTCDLIVPLALPQTHCFSFHTSPGHAPHSSISVTQAEPRSSCVCGTARLGEDLLCLVHGGSNQPQWSGFCCKDTPYLAKDQVMRWFQSSVTKAWQRIAHKYNFELMFRHLDSPGSLKVCFHVGKMSVLNLNLLPGVRLKDTDAYFVTHFPSGEPNFSDTCWPLSFAVYEKELLRHLAKQLPLNSCHLQVLQIAEVLLHRQTGLTGPGALSTYYLKTALLHQLLSVPALDWEPKRLGQRLLALFTFLELRLLEKKLLHVLLGNRRLPESFPFPAAFRTAQPVNLLQPLVMHRHLYTATLNQLQELMRNTPLWISEFTSEGRYASLQQPFHCAG